MEPEAKRANTQENTPVEVMTISEDASVEPTPVEVITISDCASVEPEQQAPVEPQPAQAAVETTTEAADAQGTSAEAQDTEAAREGVTEQSPQADAHDTQGESKTEQVAAEPPEVIKAKRAVVLDKVRSIIKKGDKGVLKGSAALAKLMLNDYNADTAADFAPALFDLRVAMTDQRQKTKPLAQASREVFEIVSKSLAALEDSLRFPLETATLDLFVGVELQTDDSFQFGRAGKLLDACIESLDQVMRSKSVAMEGMAKGFKPSKKQSAERQAAIVNVLGVLASYASTSWAKPVVNHSFSLARQRRLLLQPHYRDQLDELLDKLDDIEKRQNGRSSTKLQRFQNWSS
eukprot:m.23751 g.23751  ORF g.23751 m.23751 type:complete len:347 (-) comp8527_c0_seq1:1657-2697(-)